VVKSTSGFARANGHASSTVFAGPHKGIASLEAVMVAAVLVPLAFAIFMLAMKATVFVYEVVATLLEWPYP